MCGVQMKKTAWLTTFLFIFLLLINSLPQYSQETGKGENLIKKGEKLYLNGDYQEALDVWLQAVPLVKDNKVLAGLYLYISKANFKLGNNSRTEEFLRKMFEIQPRKIPKEDDLDSDFSVIYNKVKAEYWFNFRVESQEDQDSQQKVIEKLSKKPKKKKKKILPILIIGFLAIAAAVVTIILSSKDEENYGTLVVRNNTELTINVRVGVSERSLGANDSTRYFLAVGDYTVEFYDIDHTQTHNITIIKGESVSISFSGW